MGIYLTILQESDRIRHAFLPNFARSMVGMKPSWAKVRLIFIEF